jgi:GAF domain-containing protein
MEPPAPEPLTEELFPPEPAAMEPPAPEPLTEELFAPEPAAMEPPAPAPVPEELFAPEPVAPEPIAGVPFAREAGVPESYDHFVPGPGPSARAAGDASAAGGEAGKEAEEPAAPSPSGSPLWETSAQERQRKTLDIMLYSLTGIASAAIILLLANLIRDPAYYLGTYVPYLAAYTVLVVMAIGRRLDPRVRSFSLALLAYSVGVGALVNEGPLSVGGFYLLAAPLLLALLVNQRMGIAGAIASACVFAAALLADHLGLLHPSVPYNPQSLTTVVSMILTFAMIIAALMFVQWMLSSSLVGALRAAKEDQAETSRSRTLLERWASELSTANARLQQRAYYLQATSRLSEILSGALDLTSLTEQAVTLVARQFALDQVSLFLVEESGLRAMLASSIGEGSMPETWIEVGSNSVIARCAANGQAHVALDLGPEAAEFDSFRFPTTRSHVVVPLQSRGRMVGVLDMQSVKPRALTEEGISVLETMADRIAAAIDNARLFRETQARVGELEALQRQYVREQWTKFVETRTASIFERKVPDLPGLSEASLQEDTSALSAAIARAIERREIITQSDSENGPGEALLVAPVMLRGEVIGALGLHEPEGSKEWTEDEIALVETVATQMALAIENARLLEETQQRAERERIITDVTTRVRASMDLESILQTAVRELGAALGSDRAFIRLGVGVRPVEE